ncbi:hypothetical protein D3C84_1128310 [compost metagenome]
MLPSCEQARHLAHGRDRTCGKQRAGDQGTDSHFTDADLIDADDQHGDVAQLLDQQRSMTEHCG